MLNIVKSLKKVFSQKKYFIISGVTGGLVLVLYYYAIVAGVSWAEFIQANHPLFVFFQIFFSIINALLVGIAISMFVYVLQKRKKTDGLSITQAVVSLFLSVASTGCYVCGSILLPSLGIAASFTALPFGGIEIKILTIILLLYSISQYSNKILEICKIETFRIVRMKIGNKNFSLSTEYVSKAKPFLITGSIVVLIFTLPVITKSLGFNGYLGANDEYSCNATKRNK